MTELRSMQTGKTQRPKYLRQPGDQTPLRVPGVKILDTGYEPDPKPIIRLPLVSLRWATPKELGRGAKIVHNAAIRHGWDVQITYCKGYPPGDDVPTESFALRMSKDDRRSVAVWEDGNVSCAYYWVRGADGSTEQPRKVTTTDLTGQRETKHREYRKALFEDVDNDPGGDTPTVSRPVVRARKPAEVAVTPTVIAPSAWSEVSPGDQVRGKDGSPWLVTRVGEIKGKTYPTIDISVSNGKTELHASVKPTAPVYVLKSAETKAQDLIAAIFPDTEVVTPSIQANVWLGELQVEQCRQRGVGCNHERCRWERKKRKGRLS